MASGKRRIQLKRPSPAVSPLEQQIKERNLYVCVWKRTDITSEGHFGEDSLGSVKIVRNQRNPEEKLLCTTIKDSSDDCFRKMFICDLELSQVKHENVHGILALSMEPLALYHEVISMSLQPYHLQIEVGNLADLLRQSEQADIVQRLYKDLNLPSVIIGAVVSGLTYLHSNNVKLVQLAPQNILIGQRKLPEEMESLSKKGAVTCKLRDFIRTRQYCEQTQTGLATKSLAREKLTVPYQSPERLVYHSSCPDPGREDVWSLGMVTYFVLNPDVPFPFSAEFIRSTTKDFRLFVVQNLEQGRLPEMSSKYDIGTQEPHLVAMMMLCLLSNPEERPNVSELLECLREGTGPTSITLSNRPKALFNLLRTTESQAQIRHELRRRSVRASLEIGSSHIVVYALTRKAGQETVDVIEASCVHEDIKVDTVSKAILASKKWDDFVEDHVKQNQGMLHINTNYDHGLVHVAAHNAKAKYIKDEIHHFLMQNTIIEKVINVPAEKLEFVQSYLPAYVSNLPEMPTLSFQTEEEFSVKISGNMDVVNAGSNVIDTFIKSVHTAMYVLDKPALVWYFQQPEGQAKMSEIGKHFSAIVRIGEVADISSFSGGQQEGFVITAGSEDAASTCVDKLKDTCGKLWLEKSVPLTEARHKDDWRDQIQTIKRMAFRMHVDMEVLNDAIYLAGIRAQVNALVESIYKVLIQGIAQHASEKELAALELVQTQVKWFFELKGDFSEFSVDHNALLERAYTEKMHQISYLTDQGLEVVDLIKMEGRGELGSFRVIRQQQGEVPSGWSKMDKSLTLFRMDLASNSKEFNDVKSEILRTSQNKIKQIMKIERILNPGLYRKYQVHKEEVEKAGTGGHIERRLWHGTDTGVIDSVISMDLTGDTAVKMPLPLVKECISPPTRPISTAMPKLMAGGTDSCTCARS